MSALLAFVFLLSGAAALLFQSLWFRLAGLTFGNSVWASSLVLASFMAGLAAGNVLAARFRGRIDELRLYAALEALIGATGFALVLLLPRSTAILAPLLQALARWPVALNIARLSCAFLLMLVPATGMGATLPILVRRLSRNDADFGPVWSPNGKQIAFASDADGDPEIVLMNADGTGITQLTNNRGVADFGPAWSPDGKQIAFTSDRDGNGEIYVMNVDGTGVTRLTNNAAFDFLPVWSPDGKQLAFVSNRNGYFHIYIMNADGTGVTQVTKDGFSDFGLAWTAGTQ